MTDIPSGSSDYREDAIGTCKKKASKVSWTYLGPGLFGSTGSCQLHKRHRMCRKDNLKTLMTIMKISIGFLFYWNTSTYFQRFPFRSLTWMNDIRSVTIYLNVRPDKCKLLLWMYIKYFYLKKKTNEMFNQRLLQCSSARFLIILRIFKCIASTDNAFKILVTLNLAHTVS